MILIKNMQDVGSTPTTSTTIFGCHLKKFLAANNRKCMGVTGFDCIAEIKGEIITAIDGNIFSIAPQSLRKVA